MAEEHLRFGGSSAHRWMRCAGSVSLLETIPQETPSSYMQAGTRAHALLEKAVIEGMVSVHAFEGKALAEHDPVFEEDEIRAVQIALEYVRELAAVGAAIRAEAMYRLLPDTGGTADIVALDSGARILEIVDYKHGAGVRVDPEDNEQLLLYAASVVRELAEEELADLDGFVVRLTIIQPRCTPDNPIRSADYPIERVMSFGCEAEAARNVAVGQNPPFCPGDHCYSPHPCKAARVCKALMQHLADVPDPRNVALEPDDSDLVFRFPSPERARDNLPALGQFKLAIPALKAWIKSVEEYAEQQARQGAVIPGQKLVRKRGTREWEDEKAARAWLEANTWLFAADMEKRTFQSVAQIEGALRETGQADVIKAMAHLVKRESSGFKLVPESEKGDAVTAAELGEIGGGSAADAALLDPSLWKD